MGASREAFLGTGMASMKACLAAEEPGFPPVSRKITPPPLPPPPPLPSSLSLPTLSLSFLDDDDFLLLFFLLFFLCFFWAPPPPPPPPSPPAAIFRSADLKSSISRHTSSSHALCGPAAKAQVLKFVFFSGEGGGGVNSRQYAFLRVR